MDSGAVSIGLVDGPLDRESAAVTAVKWFRESEENAAARQHAGAIANAIRRHAPDAMFRNAVIFGGGLTTSRSAVVEALRWLRTEPPDIVHCSFGVPAGDEDLAGVVRELVDIGAVVVASAPARGAMVYPAGLPGVIAVQGDARCGPDDLSWLNIAQADFGAHVFCTPDSPVRGASAAAAHFTGHLAAALASGVARDAAIAQLRDAAAWNGPERRTK